MTPEDELRQCTPLKGHWFHSIEVAPGVWTNGHKTRETMAYELEAWKFPADLTGKTILDIGCADGGWSVAALQRGAQSVTAIDEQMTLGMRLLQAAKTFPGIEFRQMSLFSDAFMSLPQYDFVIFTGVLYHVQDMLEALKRVRLRTAGEVLLETHLNESQGLSPPMAVFYEKDELGADPTNWWGPNTACLEAMLRTAGFAYERGHELWEDETHANGRVSYHLTAVPGSVFADVAQSATGSNSLLEETRHAVARLAAENADLRAQLAAANAVPKAKTRWF